MLLTGDALKPKIRVGEIYGRDVRRKILSIVGDRVKFEIVYRRRTKDVGETGEWDYRSFERWATKPDADEPEAKKKPKRQVWNVRQQLIDGEDIDEDVLKTWMVANWPSLLNEGELRDERFVSFLSMVDADNSGLSGERWERARERSRLWLSRGGVRKMLNGDEGVRRRLLNKKWVRELLDAKVKRIRKAMRRKT